MLFINDMSQIRKIDIPQGRSSRRSSESRSCRGISRTSPLVADRRAAAGARRRKIAVALIEGMQ